MILMREKCTFSRSRDCHGLFFMNKQRMCVWARTLLNAMFLKGRPNLMLNNHDGNSVQMLKRFK